MDDELNGYLESDSFDGDDFYTFGDSDGMDTDDFDDFSEIGGVDDFDDSEDFGMDMEDFETEGDYFFKKLWRGIKSTAKKVGKAVAPIAKKLLPVAAKAIGGAFGGPAGAMIGGNIGSMIANLEDDYDGFDGYSEADYYGDYEDSEDTEDEMSEDEEFLGMDAEDDELAEAMADAASKAPSSTDAGSLAAASASAVTKKAPPKVKRVTPVISSASGRLAKVFRKHPKARVLTKAIPTIQKRTVATLTKKAAKGKPVTPKTCKRVMIKHTAKVLKSPMQISKAVAKNELKRRKFDKKAVLRAEKFA